MHPYLLLNHYDDFESLSTFVHEWGHAVHSLLANKTQPFENASYSPFIAETASITNEMLLSDYMVAHAKTDAEKLFYLGKALELIRVDFFRQTLFAEFQLAIHDEMEKGGSVSGERMTDMYCGLLKKYYGHVAGRDEGRSRLLRGMGLTSRISTTASMSTNTRHRWLAPPRSPTH